MKIEYNGREQQMKTEYNEPLNPLRPIELTITVAEFRLDKLRVLRWEEQPYEDRAH